MDDPGKTAGRDATQRMTRGIPALLAAVLLVLALSSCRSRPEMDHRPGWVREAEARLQKQPSWGATGPGLATGTDASEEESSRSSFFGSGRQATAPSQAQAERTATPQPAGVQWSDTRITVQVEE
ncbi:MAG TPA: hypothetical protein VJ952_03275 [Opitutales bacterium]|nr:hypothetical protein [Opitutales bacterium]